MDLCGRCKTEKLQLVSVDDAMEVAGHTFTAQLPARGCPKCGDVLIEARELREFEQAVVLALAQAGERSGAAVRALRKAAAFSVTRLAELLEVPSTTVTAWEEGAAAIPVESAALLRGLVLSKLGAVERPLDGLSLLRRPRQLAQRVRVHLKSSVERLAAGLSLPAGGAVYGC